MSRLTIPKIPLKSLIMIIRDYLSLPRLISKGTLPKNEIFHRPKTIQSDSYPFLWSRQHEPFWAKETKIVQTWLKPCPLIETTWTTFDPKEPCQDSSHCRDTPSQHPPTIKAPNLNKEKEMKKGIMIFSSCIQDIWINLNKRNPHQRNEKPGVLEKEKSEVINQFSSRNCSLIK